MRISEIILKKNLQLWGSNGPNGQLYTIIYPYIANWMIIRYRSHRLREPGKSIDIVFYKDAYVQPPIGATCCSWDAYFWTYHMGMPPLSDGKKSGQFGFSQV